MTKTPLLWAALLAAGCATTQLSGPAAAAPVPDTSLGLAKGSVFAVATPPPLPPNEGPPGTRPTVPPAFPGAPPVIPHGTSDFTPITAKQNSCIDCHAVASKEKKAGQPTPMPLSHYTDLRNAPDRVADKVAGARYLCVSCHVVRSDAAPLVQNRSQP